MTDGNVLFESLNSWIEPKEVFRDMNDRNGEVTQFLFK